MIKGMSCYLESLYRFYVRHNGYFDTATVAILCLGVGITLGELEHNGSFVVSKMFVFFALSAVLAFGSMALWRSRHDRRSVTRNWTAVILGTMLSSSLSLFIFPPGPYREITGSIALIAGSIFLSCQARGRRDKRR